ncbi:hypothetical protein ACS0TY_022780 [Phlomoides rotata]
MELVKLRQQQQNTKSHLQAMEKRLKGTELKQQQALSFLWREIQNPDFLQKIVEDNNMRKEISKKRRKKNDDGQNLGPFDGNNIHVKIEPQGYGDDMDLAMGMDGSSLINMEEHACFSSINEK